MYIVKLITSQGDITYDGPMDIIEAQSLKPYNIGEILGHLDLDSICLKQLHYKMKKGLSNIIEIDGGCFLVKWL